MVWPGIDVPDAFNGPLMMQVAVTGELSLSGKLFPVGDLVEKARGAMVMGIKTVLHPPISYDGSACPSEVDLRPSLDMFDVLQAVVPKGEWGCFVDGSG